MQNRNLFRMSSPVVAIGFILLIPSVLGMLFSSLVLLGVLSNATEGGRIRNEAITRMRQASVPESVIEDVVSKKQEDVESWMSNAEERGRTIYNQRQAVAEARTQYAQAVTTIENAAPRMRDAGIPEPVIVMLWNGHFEEAEQWLSVASPVQTQVFREAEDQVRSAISSAVSAMRVVRSLKVSEDVMDDLVSNTGAKVGAWLSQTESVQNTNTHQQQAVRDATKQLNATPETIAVILGSGFAIFLGVTSFVGGLLGWLLVMRKRVLKCSACGAVVSAS